MGTDDLGTGIGVEVLVIGGKVNGVFEIKGGGVVGATEAGAEEDSVGRATSSKSIAMSSGALSLGTSAMRSFISLWRCLVSVL